MQILRIQFQTIPRKRTQLGISFRTTKTEIYYQNGVQNHSVEEKPTQNKTRQHNISIIVSEKTTFDVQTNHFVKLFAGVCKTNFLCGIPFHFVSSFGIGSSVELGMPQNECFLPRNSGNHSESIPRNFFGKKFRSQPYLYWLTYPLTPLSKNVLKLVCIVNIVYGNNKSEVVFRYFYSQILFLILYVRLNVVIYQEIFFFWSGIWIFLMWNSNPLFCTYNRYPF